MTDDVRRALRLLVDRSRRQRVAVERRVAIEDRRMPQPSGTGDPRMERRRQTWREASQRRRARERGEL